ncbi:MAG: choice-of-anchor Q domain-containing protein [Lysobacterales bacterium]
MTPAHTGTIIGLRRCRRLPLAICVGLLLVAAHPSQAATLPVTSCADDGSPGTLRSVMYSAHNHDVVDLTRLTCSTITLTQGEIDVSWIGSHRLAFITIDGPGRDQLTVVGAGPTRVFAFGDSYYQSQAEINDLTITHSGPANTWPACVLGISGVLALNRVTVTGCHAHTPDFPYVGIIAGAVGAAQLVMSDSTVSNSSFTAYGNDIATGGGITISELGVIVDSAVVSNQAIAAVEFGYGGTAYPTSGGGIYSDGDLLIVNSTIAGNSVEVTNPGEDGVGGGLFVRGTLTMIDSTVSGNTVDGMGAGLYKASIAPGFDRGTTVSIQNSTIAGNSAGGAGGALASQRPVWLANSTIASNYSGAGGAVLFVHSGTYPGSGRLELESTIIGSNTTGPAATYAADLATDDVLTVTGAHSLVVAPAAGIVLPPDTLHDDPRLLPLDWNGGSVQTLALAPGSPAIDAGSNPLGLSTDERGAGYVRESGAAPDIGAFEVQPGPDPIFAGGFDP